MPHATWAKASRSAEIGGGAVGGSGWAKASRSASTAMSSASLEAVELRVSSGGSPLLASLCTSLEGSSASTSGTTMLFIAAGRNLRTNEGSRRGREQEEGSRRESGRARGGGQRRQVGP